ncbi:MAG: DNA-processing protein DprA [Elusimicrobiales bacterium]
MEIEKLKSLIKINSVAVNTSTSGFYDFIVSHRDPDLFFENPDEIFFPNELLREKVKKYVNDAMNFNADKELEECDRLCIRIITCLDDDYPEEFKNISNPPLLVYCLGKPGKRLSVSIVGTRHPTDYGIRHASRISSDLAKAGICVVSGLARGIDTVVHKSVLKVKGITWAVIGSGLKKIYPAENRALVDKIVENGGCVISEYPLNTSPFKFNFPRRNRLISALSFGTLVIEGDYSSGALITARYAVEQGKEVMALPGCVDSRQSNGPNKLIKEGAYPIRNALDVIDLIPPSQLFEIDINRLKEEKAQKTINMSDGAARIYTLLKEKGEMSMDEISEFCSMNVNEIFGYLFELETAGAVEARGGKYRTSI